MNRFASVAAVAGYSSAVAAPEHFGHWPVGDNHHLAAGAEGTPGRNAMTQHVLEPTPGTTAEVFSRDLPPVLTVDPGDTVVARSLDASGFLERQQHPGDLPPVMFSNRRGHCLTGPIAVRGATAG